jgi:RND family efflux transporter MFP subunit
VNGVVAKVLVREGQRVKAGETLVVLQSEMFAIGVRQADAGLQAARAGLEAAELGVGRARRLRGSESMPQAQLDGAEAQYKGAKAQVALAEAGLDQARKALRDTVITAPYDAVVVRRLVNEGEFAAMMPPTPLVVLEEGGIVDLRLNVPSTLLGRLAEGDPLAIRFPATGREIQGKVTRVVPSVNPMTRSFNVLVELPDPEGTLQPGLYAEARMVPAEKAP